MTKFDIHRVSVFQDVSGNNLKELPSSLCGLPRLRTLDLSNNPKMSKLPKELCKVRGLEKLVLTPETITYPDPKVAKEGTEAIMRFLCKGILKDRTRSPLPFLRDRDPNPNPNRKSPPM